MELLLITKLNMALIKRNRKSQSKKKNVNLIKNKLHVAIEQ